MYPDTYVFPTTCSLYPGVLVPIPTSPLTIMSPDTPIPPYPAATELYVVSYPTLKPDEFLISVGASKSTDSAYATYQSKATSLPPAM